MQIAMEMWQILAVAGAVLFIIEMLTPAMFFLNLAIACGVTAIVAVFYPNWYILIPLWAALSGLFLLFLRPLLVKKHNSSESASGMSQYVGKKAKVAEKIDQDNGVIMIFDERWNARSQDGQEIPAGSVVVITGNDNLIMYVKKEK